MSDDERDAARRDEGEDDEESGSTPFDHPFFLPVVLWAFAAWFAYDIVTQAEAYLEYPNFNRGGVVVTGLLAIWFTWKAVKERRDSRGSGPD